MKGLADFWSAVPLGRGVTLRHADANGLAALVKPAGVLSHPNAPGEERRSLVSAPYAIEDECYRWAETGASRLWLINRLDSATSGLILVATDGALAAAVRAQFKRKQVHKVYQALVFGRPRQAAETWVDRLATDKRGGRIRTGAGHVPAESRMTLVRAGTGVALLNLEPRTGRSHQLRVQCAKHGVPIVGDQTYGDFPRNREFAKRAGTKRLFLHSGAIDFDYEWGGRTQHFAAAQPAPAEFEKYL